MYLERTLRKKKSKYRTHLCSSVNAEGARSSARSLFVAASRSVPSRETNGIQEEYERALRYPLTVRGV